MNRSNTNTKIGGVFVINRQMGVCAGRIADPIARERFLELLMRANQLNEQARNLRLLAWSDYRRLTGLAKGGKTDA
jgi:hypothetical protein